MTASCDARRENLPYVSAMGATRQAVGIRVGVVGIVYVSFCQIHTGSLGTGMRMSKIHSVPHRFDYARHFIMFCMCACYVRPSVYVCLSVCLSVSASVVKNQNEQIVVLTPSFLDGHPPTRSS